MEEARGGLLVQIKDSSGRRTGDLYSDYQCDMHWKF